MVVSVFAHKKNDDDNGNVTFFSFLHWRSSILQMCMEFFYFHRARARSHIHVYLICLRMSSILHFMAIGRALSSIVQTLISGRRTAATMAFLCTHMESIGLSPSDGTEAAMGGVQEHTDAHIRRNPNKHQPATRNSSSYSVITLLP